MSRQSDPYLKPSEDLNRRLGQIASVFGKLNETGISKLTPQDRLRLEGDLRQHVSNCEWELSDVEEAFQQIETNRMKFSFITDDQLQERRAFIQRSKIYLQGIKSRMGGGNPTSATSSQNNSNPATQKLIDVDIYNERSTFNNNNASSGHSSAYTSSIIQEQQSLLRNQDEHLDALAGGVSLLKDMSQRIGTELDEQDVMLDDLGTDMEHSQRRIDTLLARTQKILRLSNDRRQWCAILFLVGALIVVICLLAILK